MLTSANRTPVPAPSANGHPPRRCLNVLVATADPVARAFFEQALPALGHKPVLAGSGGQVLDLCRAAAPDLVIADATLPDADGFELAAAVCRERPVPVILTADDPDLGAVWGAAGCHVLGYLARPLSPEALGVAVAVAVRSFDRIRAAEEEVGQLRQALEDRKVIERAKGAAVRRCGLDEAETYSRMRRLASNHNRKLVEVARQILAAEDVFQGLEEADL